MNAPAADHRPVILAVDDDEATIGRIARELAR